MSQEPLAPSDLSYDMDEHLWFEIDGDEAKVGITDFAQDQLGEIMFVELPELTQYSGGDFLLSLESGKKDQDIVAPFDLEVIEVNEELEDYPELINDDAFEAWICRIKILSENGLEDLVEADEYLKRVEYENVESRDDNYFDSLIDEYGDDYSD